MDTIERSGIVDEKRRDDDVELGTENESEPSATGTQPFACRVTWSSRSGN